MRMTVEQISKVTQDIADWLSRTLPDTEHIPVSINQKLVDLTKADAVRFLVKLSRLMRLSDFKPLNKLIIQKTKNLFESIGGLTTKSRSELYSIWIEHDADSFCSFSNFESAYLTLMEEKDKQ